MNSTIEFANNPFFIYDIDKLCAICNNRLEKDKMHSIFGIIPKSEPNINAFEVIASISNFRIDNGPQMMCATCFHNATSVYRFRLLSNRAHKNIESYLKHQEEMKVKNEINHDNEVGMTITNTNGVKEEDEALSDEIGDSTEPGVESSQIELDDANRTKTGAKKRKCKVCYKMYRHDYLPIHMRQHTGERPYQCNICNNSFKTSTTLQLHKRTHSDNRAYICNYCGKSFKFLGSLRLHERGHTGEKPYKCNYCPKAFTDSTLLKHHLLVHTKEKLFQCEICAKRFGRKTHLRQHLVSHSDVKKHECHLCGNRFTQAHSLRTHIKMSCQARKYAVQDVATETLVEDLN